MPSRLRPCVLNTWICDPACSGRTWVHKVAVSRLSTFLLSSFRNGALRRGQKSAPNSSDHRWVTLSPPEVQKLYSRKAPVALSATEKPPTCSMGMNRKLLTSQLRHCFGKADQSCQLLCWELKRNRKRWRKLRASWHWHWGAVLWDQFDNPSQVFLRSLMLLRWPLLTSGQQGWMAPCFPMYQLFDTTPCVLSVWWFTTS